MHHRRQWATPEYMAAAAEAAAAAPMPKEIRYSIPVTVRLAYFSGTCARPPLHVLRMFQFAHRHHALRKYARLTVGDVNPLRSTAAWAFQG